MSGLPKMTLSPGAVDFINDEHIESLLKRKRPDILRVRELIAKSMAKQSLTVEETADLLLADSPEMIEEIFASARQLKRDVYGNRIVLFAPLYIGNDCVNDCAYCAFKRSNQESVRRTLEEAELKKQVEALEKTGHKRLIMVFGEHPSYDGDFMAKCIETVYSVKTEPHGEIRRVNLNAAPTDHETYRKVKAARIGTFQIFQETYHHATYAKMHPANTRKGNYQYRLDGLSRAMEAGIDDVGIGSLFGLADWRFEVLGLVTHALHLQERYNVGPHTISFPRIQPAAGVQFDKDDYTQVDDESFKRLIAILRLAVPYTGLICTARENAEVRRAVMEFGVSQIDAGTRIEIGGYTEAGDAQVMEREQFRIGDIRSLDETMLQLVKEGYVPSFCTACYRIGRTGEHFMEFSIPGFIKRFCTPNALTTLEEYLVDYATPETRAEGEKLIEQELSQMKDGKTKTELLSRLERIRSSGDRDLYF